MTIYEMIMNDNIRSDRYAMAAISNIFKAFGDDIRSKEFWPWGDKVQCPWTISKGTDEDISEAELLLERARLKYNDETEININNEKYYSTVSMNNLNKNIKDLQKQVEKIQRNINKINQSSSHSTEVSTETTKAINKLNN